MADVADIHFSTFEGKIQAVSSREPVGLGRDPGECHMSVLVHFGGHGSHRIVATQTSLLDGQNSQSSEARQGCSLRHALRVTVSPFATAASGQLADSHLNVIHRTFFAPSRIDFVFFLLSFPLHSDHFRSLT